MPEPVTDSPRAHETGDEADCWCSPKVEPVKRDDGSVGWLVTHRREAVSDSPAETRHAIVERRPAVSAWTWGVPHLRVCVRRPVPR